VEATVTGSPTHSIVHRADDSGIEDGIEQARQRMADSIRILQTHTLPDTFFGRQHYDLIPAADHDMMK
jgi:hypothetical protein